MAEELERKIRRAIFSIARNVGNTKKDVAEMKEVLWDIGQKLCYVIERRFDYNTLPAGIDYENCYRKAKRA